MQKLDLLKLNGTIVRILDIQQDRVLVIDCCKRTMPQWYSTATFETFDTCTTNELESLTDMELCDIELLDPASRKFIYEHYTMIAGVLPFISDEKLRSHAISRISEDRNVSKQTIRNYLCLYLAYQDMSAFAPKKSSDSKPLTNDEKNMRWALNKFFYTQRKNSLNTAYTLMLKAKYSDCLGNLLPEYPSFNQFRYFYMQSAQRDIIKAAMQDNLQAKIALAEHIETIACSNEHAGNTSTKSIRNTRKREQQKRHKDHLKAGEING